MEHQQISFAPILLAGLIDDSFESYGKQRTERPVTAFVPIIPFRIEIASRLRVDSIGRGNGILAESQ